MPDLPVIPLGGLYGFLLVIAVAVALFVGVLVTLVLVRYHRPPNEEAPQTHGNKTLEITWTAIPLAVVLGLFAFTIYTMNTNARTPGAGLPAGKQPDVVVTGRQWWWKFYYPKLGITTANELHIPAGQNVLVELTSDNVQHDFWVPELGQKMDMYPNQTNYTWLYAQKPGDYGGACAEYCGAEHAWMRIRVLAQSPLDYQAWVKGQQAAARAPTTTAEKAGAELFAAEACGSCHTIGGTQWNGDAAPNLTHFASRGTISAGVLTNTPEHLSTYLHNPSGVKPGIYMPNYRFNDQQVQALVAYLESLK